MDIYGAYSGYNTSYVDNGYGYRNPQQPLTQPKMTINGTFVGSLEEVQRLAIPADGMIYVFPDSAHNVIYTKQVNLIDGSISVKTYEYKPQQVMPMPMLDNNKSFVSREEFENLTSKIDNIIEQLGGSK